MAVVSSVEPLIVHVTDTLARVVVEDNLDESGERPICLTVAYDDYDKGFVCIGLTPEEGCQVILKIYELIQDGYSPNPKEL